jgi:DNA (cytosine-5-)-methyltransferase
MAMYEQDRFIAGDCREVLPMLARQRRRFQTCVTSPPYFRLRDYGGQPGQIGLETSVADYVASLVEVFNKVREVLKEDGTLWLNLGDSYVSRRNRDCTGDVALKTKDLMGLPWRVALALQDDGWYLRQDIIWHKPNAMPESVSDRCTQAHEYLFLLSKRPRYYFNADAISELSLTFGEPDADDKANFARNRGKRTGVTPPGSNSIAHRADRAPTIASEMRNRRSVWEIATTPTLHPHTAPFPRELVELCLMAGTQSGDWVLDPFGGSGTTAAVANELGRHWVSIELDARYRDAHEERTLQMPLNL